MVRKNAIYIYEYRTGVYQAVAVPASVALGHSQRIFSSETDSESSLISSLSNTRRRIRRLAVGNSWEWFGTITIDPKIYGYVYDYEKAYSIVHDRFLEYSLLYSDFAWLVVPEQHKSGVWHFHALLSGIPRDSFKNFLDFDTPVPRKLLTGEYYDCHLFSSIGFNSWSCVKDPMACAVYLSKYLTKNLYTVLVRYRHRYFCSRGLSQGRLFYSEILSDEEWKDIASLFDWPMVHPLYGSSFVVSSLFTNTLSWVDVVERLPDSCSFNDDIDFAFGELFDQLSFISD